MDKIEHIKYWVDMSEEDWDTANKLFELEKYLNSLFFGHLVLEKLAKACWVKHSDENYPPRLHNIVILLEQAEVVISEEQKKFFITVNEFQIEGRYPDYIRETSKKLNKSQAQGLLLSINKERLWLLKNLQ